MYKVFFTALLAEHGDKLLNFLIHDSFVVKSASENTKIMWGDIDYLSKLFIFEVTPPSTLRNKISLIKKINTICEENNLLYFSLIIFSSEGITWQVGNIKSNISEHPYRSFYK